MGSDGEVTASVLRHRELVIAFTAGSLLLASIGTASCYRMRSPGGGGKANVAPQPVRHVVPDDVAVPPGYRVEAVATGLTFPTGVVFDDQDRLYVVEAGYSYGEDWAEPRLIRIDGATQFSPVATGTDGPWNGAVFANGAFYIAVGGELKGGQILRVTADGQRRILIDNLPSVGDHHVDGPAAGPDGRIYFGLGVATNSGIVGEDNAQFGWLKRRPDFHDIPCRDVTLSGENFDSNDPLRGSGERVSTGAFLPFGTPSTKGQTIRGAVPCSGSVLRISTDGGAPELYAWGFRNPFGLAFAPDGKLYVSDNGYDERGSRPVWGTADYLWAVTEGGWYGWPDYSGEMPLTKEDFQPPGKPPLKLLLANPPGKPPKPAATFGVHSSSNGLDFSRNASFGHVGNAFVAQFGDMSPSAGKVLHPVGYQVVRVDVKTGVMNEFMANRHRTRGPASKFGGGGIERPVAVRFNPKGDALYVVDFGIMTMSDRGPQPRKGTGVLWRITRGGGA
jgi:glucose/arabinose dehydrogenase